MPARSLIELQLNSGVSVRPPVTMHQRVRQHGGGGPPPGLEPSDGGGGGSNHLVVIVGRNYDYTEQKLRLSTVQQAIEVGDGRMATKFSDGTSWWRGYVVWAWNETQARMMVVHKKGEA